MRRPYLRLYQGSEWSIHMSLDGLGSVLQINLGRLGLTIPTRKKGNA